MATVSIRIDKELFDDATKEGNASFRSGAQQINFWATVGRNALANPDLSINFVAELLVAKDSPAEPFVFEGSSDNAGD